MMGERTTDKRKNQTRSGFAQKQLKATQTGMEDSSSDNGAVEQGM